MAEEKKQEQQVIEEVVKEEYVEVPHKWTFLKYLKSIVHFKWWVIGFTLFGALAGFLGLRFILNPMRKTLSATYTYNLAGDYVDEDTIRFIDGSLFNPYELTSRENLQKVKDKDNKYAYINIDKIVASNAIVIKKNINYYNDYDYSNISINYSIEAKSNIFPNDEIGKSYLYDLINLAKDLSTDAIGNFTATSYIAKNFDDLTFDREIGQLSDQYSYIFSVYSSLEARFGESAIANENNEKLHALLNDYVSQFYISGVTSFTDYLSGQKDSNKFVNYVVGQEEEKISEIHNTCESYIENIKNNEEQITLYEERLDKLLSAASIIDSSTNVSEQIANYNGIITSLKLNNNQLNKELNNNGYFLNNAGEYVFDDANENTIIYKLTHKEAGWVAANQKYKELIKEYKNLLENSKTKAEAAYRYCHMRYQNKINIQDGGYVQLSGGISDFIGLAAGLVLFFIVTSLVCAAIYVNKGKNENVAA